MEKMTYAAAGVDIDAGMKLKKIIGRMAQPTFGPEVMRGIGFFGGLYEFKGYRQPILVSHVDGVGTKMKIAIAMDKHDTIGVDIVNHCVNDIFVGGASPLFFQDYIAMGKLNPARVEAVVSGLVNACKEVGCALIGGETPEMPGIYAEDDYDLVGFIVGVVEKDKIKLGDDVKAGDAVLGLPSSGPHTNGYSLIRSIFGTDPKVLQARSDELGTTLGAALLEPHRCYFNQLKPLMASFKALAHITGGSFYKNIPRVLPEGLGVRLDSRSWTVPALFRLIQNKGNVEENEMYHVFNMGIGMAVICAGDQADKLLRELPGARIIGEVVPRPADSRVLINQV